jgi:hypothetical protein
MTEPELIALAAARLPECQIRQADLVGILVGSALRSGGSG